MRSKKHKFHVFMMAMCAQVWAHARNILIGMTDGFLVDLSHKKADINILALICFPCRIGRRLSLTCLESAELRSPNYQWASKASLRVILACHSHWCQEHDNPITNIIVSHSCRSTLQDFVCTMNKSIAKKDIAGLS
jgi:hypothetical protein